jgi:hypothetical protein
VTNQLVPPKQVKHLEMVVYASEKCLQNVGLVEGKHHAEGIVIDGG